MDAGVSRSFIDQDHSGSHFEAAMHLSLLKDLGAILRVEIRLVLHGPLFLAVVSLVEVVRVLRIELVGDHFFVEIKNY